MKDRRRNGAEVMRLTLEKAEKKPDSRDGEMEAKDWGQIDSCWARKSGTLLVLGLERLVDRKR
jgi:hypothetical protein